MVIDWTVVAQWLMDNWYLLAVVVTSEAMPFLNTEANGIAHAILNALGRIKEGKM